MYKLLLRYHQTIRLVFNQKLSWISYLKSLKDSCIKRFNIIEIFSNNNWSADQEILETYRALIRLDYSFTVYSRNHIKTILKSNTVLRLATDVYQTCPINSILLEARKMALDSRRKFLNIKCAIKISSKQSTCNYIFSNRYFLQ